MDVLVAVVDVNAYEWGKRRQMVETAAAANGGAGNVGNGGVLTFHSYLDQLIVFFNAFLVLNKANQLCVIAMDGTHADFVWPPSMVQRTTTSSSSTAASSPPTSSSFAPAALGVNDELVRELHNFAQTNSNAKEAAAPLASGEESASKMAGALSLGLCYLNRVHRLAAASPSLSKLRSRFLLFSICPDQASEYVSMMNGIFSTQKTKIPVDSCVLHEKDSLFLQQASHLTKGIYGKVAMDKQANLLQYLMFMYLSDTTSRQHLILPTQTQVDFRATCFCHQQVVNMGVCCPVCLSIFCKSQAKCPVCQTRFALVTPAGTVGAGVAAAAAAPRPTTPSTQMK